MTALTSNSAGVFRAMDTRSGVFIPRQQPRDIGAGDIWRAAFEQENVFGSLIAEGAAPLSVPDPDFDLFTGVDPTKAVSLSNPFLHIAGYEQFEMEFKDARSSADVEFIKRKIDRELENRRILQDAGIGGWAAMMIAGVLDPLIFIPGIGLVKGARGAVSIGRTIAASGALTGAVIGVQETGLHLTQRTRTPQETYINIAGGVILGGLLGGAIGKLTAKQHIAAVKQIDDLTTMLDDVRTDLVGEPLPPKPPTGAELDITGGPRPRLALADDVPTDAFELAKAVKPGDVMNAGALGRVEIVARSGDDITIRLADGTQHQSNIFSLEAGIRKGLIRPRAEAPTKDIATELAPEVGRGRQTIAARSEVLRELLTPASVGRRAQLARGTGPLIGTEAGRPPKAPAQFKVQVVPRRVGHPNDLRPGQQVHHPKFGEGEVIKAPGHVDPATRGVSEFNQAGRDLHNGRIVELKAGGHVRVREVFRVGKRKNAAEDALIRGQLSKLVGLQPSGKVRVQFPDGSTRIIDLDEIKGIKKVSGTGRFSTDSELVEIAFLSGGRRVKASLLTTRVGGERRVVNSFTATAADVMDGTVPDPLVSGGLVIDLFGPVRIPERPVTGLKVLDDGLPDSTTSITELAEVAGEGLIAKASIFGWDFNRFAKFLNPRLQMGMSRLSYFQGVALNLIEIPVRLAKDRVKVPSAEVRTKVRQAEAKAVTIQVQELYLQYRSGDPNAKLNMSKIVFGYRDNVAGKLRETEFWEEITLSLRGEAGTEGKAVNFDIHEIPEVQAAAKLLRAKIISPIRDELIDLGILPKEVRDFPGYMTRLYDNNMLRQPGEKQKFIDAVVEYQSKVHVQRGLPIEKFNFEKINRDMERVWEQIVSLPEGRMFPGDVAMRGPMLERTLDVPDVILQRWLVNDGERLINYYTRSLIGDIEISRRFGLQRERDFLAGGRAEIVKALREPKKLTSKPIVAREKDLLKRNGGKKFKSMLLRGNRGRGIMARDVLIRKIRKAKTDSKGVEILEAYDVKLMSAFSTGDMFLQFDRLDRLWNRRVQKAAQTDERAARKIQKQWQADTANLRLARDEVRGLAGIPDDPTHWAPRALRGLRMWTYLATAGKIALSSVPDLGLSVLNHGFVDSRAFGGMMARLISDWGTIKWVKEDANFGLGPSELITGNRANRLNSMEQEFAPRTRFGRGLAIATQKMSLLNFMSPWNQIMRTFGTMVTLNFVIASARKAATGIPLGKTALGRLAELGISEEMLVRIFQQFEKHGGEGAGRGGVKLDYAPNVKAWRDIEVRELMREVMYRGYDMNLIKGGVLDRPRFIRELRPGLGDELSKTVLFFLNFGLAANTRILGRGLQFKDAAFASGAALSVALGALSVYLKWQVSGREDPPATSLAGWVKLAVQQSGISGFVFDMDRVLEQATLGRVGLSPLFNTRGTQYYSPQTAYEALFGLPAGQVLHAIHAGSGLLDLDAEKGDVVRFRRMIPGNNLMAVSRIFDALQEKAVRAVR